MKKTKKTNLRLDRETLRTLSTDVMKNVAGGLPRISFCTCEGDDCRSYGADCSGTCC